MIHRFEDYSVWIYWHDDYQCFVAEIPDIMFCTGDGKTHEEAIGDLRETFVLLKQVAEEDGKDLPPPSQFGDITPELLGRAAEVLNISGLARKAGMSNQTLISKIKRKTQFTSYQMKAINAALLRDGVNIYQVNTKKKPGKSIAGRTPKQKKK